MSRAHIDIDPRFTIGPVQRRLFGSFVEHLGRCVYTGIYEPGHPTADEDGFRTDVLDLVRELGVSAIRYPGGNFVSGYRWEDGVGPKEGRPKRIDLAWHSVETNEFGLDEFARWADKAGSELMYAVNLGTRGVQEALDVLEYSNIASGTTLSDQRVQNGSPEPHNIRMWCLGNEMDGPWQLGHLSADDYGKIAAKTASAMRQMDPTLELVACGSSKPTMPTFAEWERVVLHHTYQHVDYISCHAYYEELEGDLKSFLASGANMDDFIVSLIATIDHVKAALKSDKTINISFDEWNVWYNKRWHTEDKPRNATDWHYAPRLLEDRYSVADAVVFGSLLISLLRHADRVTSASLAQLVNVIAPIMTEPNGPAWRQTIFYPFAEASRLATGQVLRLNLSSDTYDTDMYGSVDLVDAIATHDPESGALAVFLVNRGVEEEAEVTLDLGSLLEGRTVAASTLADDDVYAANSLETPDRVVPQPNERVSVEAGRLTIVLPAVSWTTLTVS